MLTYRRGDLFASGCDVLVNPVNLDGVMGRGLALQFKQRYPGLFPAYQQAIRDGMLDLGRVWSWRASDGQVICCLATKLRWRQQSRYEYVEDGVRDLADRCQVRPWLSVAVPPLGCGLGGLEWPRVRAIIEQHLSRSNVVVFEP